MSARDDLIAALDAYIAGTGGGRTAVRSPTPSPAGTPPSPTDRLDALQEEEDRLNELEAAGLRLRDIEAARLEIAKERAEIEREQGTLDDVRYAKRLVDLQAQEAGLESGIDAARRFAGITDQQNSIFAKMAAGGDDFIKGFGKGLSSVATATNITTSTIDKVVEATVALALEQDQAVVNFRRATGASGEFADNIRTLERSLITAGVSAAEAGQSVQTLFLNVTDFTEMSEAQQAQLAETTAVLNELGVNADNTAQNLQFATKALGMTTTEATRLQRELFTFAQDLGVSADKIAQDFQKFGPQIAALGSEGVDAFKQLEMQAKATGLAIDELVNITEQFNKFDTAAQAVGRLNAMLGGPFLNTLEMVNETNPAKRMELLKNAVDRAGLSFDQMDFYQRKAIASSMGLNEQQLALLMRGEFNVGPPPKTAEELADLAKQTAQFNTVLEELKQLGMALAISIGPVISGFKTFLQTISPLYPLLEGLAYAIIPVLISALYGMLPPIGAVTAAALGVGAAMTAIGVPLVGVVLYGLYQLTELLMPGSGPVILGIIGLAVAFKALGMAIGVATGGLVPILGLLVTLATYLFTKIASPGLIEILGLAAAAVMLLPPAMLALASSLIIILPFLPLLGVALFGLSKMLPSLAVGFSILAESVTSVLSDQFVTNLQLMAVEVANIVDSINEISATKAVAFTATMAATTAASAATALVGGGAAAGPGAGETAPAAAGGAGGPPPVININLSIDGSEFATVVNSVEVSRYNKGNQSTMYNSIIGMIEQGFAKG